MDRCSIGVGVTEARERQVRHRFSSLAAAVRNGCSQAAYQRAYKRKIQMVILKVDWACQNCLKLQ